MSEEEITIDIPKEVEYTRGLFCAIEPPQANMTIEFTGDGETKPFRIGYIKSRRIPEIAAFVFRPRKNQFTKKIDKPLEPPCKITATVKIYESYDASKDKYGKKIKEVSQEVQVVGRETGAT